MSFLKNFLIEEDGQDMVEYGLVIALVVLGAFAALGTFSGQLTSGLSAVGSNAISALK